MLNFVGIGAQKAGTTWLYSHLERHPDIVFPRRKEYHFWNTWNGKINGHFSDFCSDFSDDSSNLKYGDFTPAYSILPIERIRWLQAFEPDVKIIYILRNPIDRAWSAAKMMLKRAQLVRDEASDQWFLDVINSAASIKRSDYETCLRNWYRVFSKEQILILRFDEIVTDPLSLIRRCSDFLQIDSSFYEESGIRELEKPVFSSESLPIPPVIQQRLYEIYNNKIKKLSVYTGEDFSDWL
jgi:hypothetical protein